VKKPRAIGVGVVGLGFMGRTHVEAWRAANQAGLPNRLVAVCDTDPQRRSGRSMQGGNITKGSGAELLFDPALVHGYAELDEMLGDERVEVVSICTHTRTHVDMAVRALRAGKHVLVEKPVALTAAAMEPLVRTAAESDRLCMPAHCMRFWPGWDWLAERVREGTFGAPRSVVFRRLGSRPDWSPLYADDQESGGALVDLHLHDVDFLRFAFGDPRSVLAGGSLHHVTALYRFAGAPQHAAAEGGWDHTGGFPFRMAYLAVFDEATAEFDLSRSPALVVHRGGKSETVSLAPESGYDGEVRHLLSAVAKGRRDLRATVEDALAAARLLDAERESLRSGATVKLR